eukprot:4943714-Lingulodinium_polyedra.AAC.1
MAHKRQEHRDKLENLPLVEEMKHNAKEGQKLLRALATTYQNEPALSKKTRGAANANDGKTIWMNTFGGKEDG